MRKIAIVCAWLAALTFSASAQPGSITSNLGLTPRTLTAWTSATSVNTSQILTTSLGSPAILLQLNQTTTLTVGATTIECSFDGSTWATMSVGQIVSPDPTFTARPNPYTLEASTNKAFLILSTGCRAVRLKLTTAITGSGSVTPYVTLLNYNPTIGALLNPPGTSQYPIGATPITASNTGTTGATTATLAGVSGKTTYICTMSIRSNATAAATGAATVTGTITGTLTYQHWTAPNASGMGVTEMIYNPCVPASAVNTGIAIVSPAPGTGGVVSSNGTGYQL